jgi:hypothetical protein
MNDNKVTFVGIGFLALCLALAWGIYFLDGQLRILKDEYDELEQRRANLEQDKNGLIAEITVFKNAFSVLEDYNVRAASNDMDFYSQVQLEIDPYIRQNDVIIMSSKQNGIKDGRSSIYLKLRGDYYSFMKILAAWRNLHTTVRVSQLSMTASKNPQTSGEIQADVVLEAIVSAR